MSVVRCGAKDECLIGGGGESVTTAMEKRMICDLRKLLSVYQWSQDGCNPDPWDHNPLQQLHSEHCNLHWQKKLEIIRTTKMNSITVSKYLL